MYSTAETTVITAAASSAHSSSRSGPMSPPHWTIARKMAMNWTFVFSLPQIEGGKTVPSAATAPPWRSRGRAPRGDRRLVCDELPHLGCRGKLQRVLGQIAGGLGVDAANGLLDGRDCRRVRAQLADPEADEHGDGRRIRGELAAD